VSESDSGDTMRLILVPAIITLAVTLLRLTGELLNWSPVFFSRQAGGAGAIVGIVWLVFVFGIYFAVKLWRRGERPSSLGRVFGYPALGLALTIGAIAGTDAAGMSQNAQFLVIVAVSLVGLVIAMNGWKELGKTLVLYGLAARIPVALVMLVAIFRNWGTHYDVVPPNFPEMEPLAKWFWIGVLPQLTIWIAFTVIVGMLFGAIAAAVLSRRAAQPATAS
jgi:hypothetical protein